MHCRATDTINVTVNPIPNPNAGNDTTICNGAAITLTGSGSDNYVWNNGVVDGVSFVPSTSSYYTVTSTLGSCDISDSLFVDVVTLEDATFSYSSNSYCDNQTDPTPIISGVSGGTFSCNDANLVFVETGNNTGSSDGIIDLSATPEATYTITYQTPGNCFGTSTFDITIEPTPTWVNLQHPSNTEICIGSDLDIYGRVYEAGITDAVGQGNGLTVEYGYNTENTDPSTWTNWSAATYNLDDGNNDEYKATLSALPADTFYFSFRYKITSTNCDYVYGGYSSGGGSFWDGTSYTSGKLVVNSLPIVGSRTDTSVCYNDLFTLSGTGANTYSWDNGITNNIPFNALNTTTYIVTGTDTNSCVNTDTVTISVNPLPTVSFDGFTSGSNTGPGLDFAICFEDSLTLSGTGAVTYTWDNGVVDGQYFAPAATADYIVTGTDANSCVNTDTMTVTVNSLPGVNAGSDVTICAFDTTTLTASGATSYVWSTTDYSCDRRIGISDNDI